MSSTDRAQAPTAPAALPLVIARAEHPISRGKISTEALKVLYRLYRGGYKAYLVGGSVRDLLLKREPKDFDVATDAHPAEVKELFRNSRIIGRRFRMVHVHFGKDRIVEVSTFRCQPAPAEEEEAPESPEEEAGKAGAQGAPAHKRINENTFGTEEEDALRRDLTINGLFYDIGTFSIIDYVGGLSDLHSGLIRTIGDPNARLVEDPVRIIRAIRHAARTGFEIEPRTWAAIRDHHHLLPTCAPARLLEEFLRELRGGSSYESFRLMVKTTVLETLFPTLAKSLGRLPAGEPEPGSPWQRFAVLDRLRAERGAPPPDAIALAHMTVPLVEKIIARAADPATPRDEVARCLDELRARTEALCAELAIPRRICTAQSHHLVGLCRIRRAVLGGGLTRAMTSKSYFPEAYALYELDAISRGQTPVDPDHPPPPRRGPSRRRARPQAPPPAPKAPHGQAGGVEARVARQ